MAKDPNRRYFDSNIATLYGLSAAIVFNRIKFLIEIHEEKNDLRFFREGRWSAKCSYSQLHTYLPFLGLNTIIRAVEDLAHAKLLGIERLSNNHCWYFFDSTQAGYSKESTLPKLGIASTQAGYSDSTQAGYSPSLSVLEENHNIKKQGGECARAREDPPLILVKSDLGEEDTFEELSPEALETPPTHEESLAIGWHSSIKKTYPRAKITIKDLRDKISDLMKVLNCTQDYLSEVVSFVASDGRDYHKKIFFRMTEKLMEPDKNGITPVEEASSDYRIWRVRKSANRFF